MKSTKDIFKSKIPVITPGRDVITKNPFWSLSDGNMSDSTGSDTRKDGKDTKPPAMPPENQNSAFEDIFEQLLRDMFEIEQHEDHEVFESLEYSGITTWRRFKRSNQEIIQELTKDARQNKRVTIGKYYIHQLKVLLDMVHAKMKENFDYGSDINSYSIDEIEKYTFQYIEQKKDDSGIVPPSNDSNSYQRTTHVKSRTEKALDNWEKKRPDKTKYEVLRVDSQYLIWKEEFISEVKVQGLTRFTDPEFDESKLKDEADKDLFNKQSDYFWTVINYALQNPLARAILGDHRGKHNARIAFLDHDERQMGSVAQNQNIKQLSNSLRTLHISNHTGSRVEFVSQWFEELRQLDNAGDNDERLPYKHVRSMISRALDTDVDLTRSFTLITDVKDKHVAQTNLKAHLLEQAATLDGMDDTRHTKTRSIKAHVHQLGIDADEWDEFMIFRSMRGPNPASRLPDSIYTSLDRNDRSQWHGLSDTAKKQIVSQLTTTPNPPASAHIKDHTRKAIQAYTHSQNASAEQIQSHLGDATDDDGSNYVELGAITALAHSIDKGTAALQAFRTQTSSTAASTISSLSRPPPFNSNLTQDRKIYATESKQTKKIPLKSSLGAGSPARIMANEEDTKKRVVAFHGTGRQYYAGIHLLSYEDNTYQDKLNITPSQVEYSVSRRNIKPAINHSLVDRRANGIVAGSDCIFIGGTFPERRVHVTGMDNHQVRDIIIGTVGAYVISNRGPIICIWNEAAYTGRNQTILSAIQMEYYKNKVDDRGIHSGGGQQITTADGFNIPLSIRNGLPYLKMRPYTNKEYEQLPHVIMTSDEEWNPRIFDNEIDPNSSQYQQANPVNRKLLPHEDYDIYGEYIGVNQTEQGVPQTDQCNDLDFWVDHDDYLHSEAIARCIYGSNRMNQTDQTLVEDIQTYRSEVRSGQAPRTHIPTEHDFERMKPYFAWVPTKLIKHTFKNSTQYGFMPNSPDGNLFKRWHSPNPAMNVFRLQDDLLTDKIHSNTPAIDGGFKEAQVFFGRKSHIIHVETISKTKKFVQCLQNFVNKWGAPLRLLADHISYHASIQVLDYLRMLWIQLWFSEAYYQHQNPFERRYQTFKRIVNRTMDRTSTPPELWFLCMTYVAYVLNRVSDPTLNFKQPIHVATGVVGDISSITSFQWMEPVYYKLDNKRFTFPDTGEALGYFVGIAEQIGHAMTFKILTHDTRKIIDRSSVRSANDTRFPNNRAHPSNDTYFDDADATTPSTPTLGNENHLYTDKDYGEKISGRPPDHITPHDFIYSERLNTEFKCSPDNLNTISEEPEYLLDNIPDNAHTENKPSRITYDDDGTPMVVLIDEVGNPTIDSEGNIIMIPGKQTEDLIGITFKKRQDDGSLLRARVIAPQEKNLQSENGMKLLDEFKIKYDRNEVEDVIAYTEIINYLYRDEIQEEGYVWNYRKILAHRGPLTHRDSLYKNSKYNVSIEWENGEITEEPLNWMLKEDPITLAEYARDNGLLETEGWKSLKRIAKREKVLERLVKQVKLRSFRTSPKYMYGFQVPRDYTSRNVKGQPQV